jgi:3-isopropylmalate/(R)-2-methylmalate dehydratase small subunit
MSGSKVLRVAGTAIAVTGDDIDTDRIMPARFLKAVTFEGLEAHLFEDDRHQTAERGQRHPFDDPDRRGACVLVVGSNFGCGSSREHAPQALVRWGIRAVVGESFAEIFFGNSLMLGLPCVSVPQQDLVPLRAIAQNPTAEFEIDLATGRVAAGSVQIPFTMPDAAREALISGAWDATGMLLADYEQVRGLASRLPYLANFN